MKLDFKTVTQKPKETIFTVAAIQAYMYLSLTQASKYNFHDFESDEGNKFNDVAKRK